MIEVGGEEEEREKVRKVPFRPNWVSQKVARLYPACIGSIDEPDTALQLPTALPDRAIAGILRGDSTFHGQMPELVEEKICGLVSKVTENEMRREWKGWFRKRECYKRPSR